MELLKYEYTDAPEGSYNYILGELVKKVRYYHSNVSIDEFKAALPGLKSIETQLQRLDAEIGDDERNYLEEIMNELTIVSEIEENLFEDIQEKASAILELLCQSEFQIEEYSYEFKNHKGVFFIHFHENDDIEKEELLVVKEIFRSVCYKYGVTFIDTLK